MPLQNDFHLGKWLVRPNSNEIITKHEAQKLEHIVMQLLVFFAKNSDRDLAKEEILKGVWGNGVHNEEVLTVAVSSLRKALGDNSQSPVYIKTLHRYGYRMLQQSQVQNKTGFTKLNALLSTLEQRVGPKFVIISVVIALFFLIVLVQVAVELLVAVGQ